MTAPQFTDNTALHRYELALDGQLAAYVEYQMRRGNIVFTHTVVLPAFEGQGLGAAIARHVLDDARARPLQVIPECPYIAGYIRKHPEYVDLVPAHARRLFDL